MNISKIHSNREFHYRDIMSIMRYPWFFYVFLCTSSLSQEKRGKVQSDPAEGGLSADAALPEGLEFPSALRLLLQHGAKWTFGAEGIPPLCLYAATREVGNDIFGDEESLMVVNSCTISYNFAVSATVSLPVTPCETGACLRSAKRIGWRNMGKIAVLAMTGFALGSPQSSLLACASKGILCRSKVLVYTYFLFNVFLYFMKVGDSSFMFLCFQLLVSEL